MDTWRLIRTPPAQGTWNMALDEALLESVGRGASLPTLRLYAWEPPCLSLGYAQPFTDVDIARLQAHEWELVRRLSGGRAVLHTDELTYAVVAPLNEPRVAGSVLESYRRLANALVESLNLLGMQVQVNESSEVAHDRQTNPVCFEVSSTYEITIGGKKLVGSAQVRRREGVLQHGSMPLNGDLARIVQALAFPDENSRRLAAQRLLTRATTVESALGGRVSWNEAAQAVVMAFGTVLGLDLQPGELTPSEKNRALELAQLKYGNPSWTEKQRAIG